MTHSLVKTPSIPIIIHPGLPKTATTFLQDAVFDKHGQIANLGKPFHGIRRKKYRLHEICRWISQDSREQWATHEGRVRDALNAALNDVNVVDPARHRCIMLSHEGWFHPQYDATPREVLQRWTSLIGDNFRMLVTVRAQPAWIESYYLYRFAGRRREPAAGLGISAWLESERGRSWNACKAMASWDALEDWRAAIGNDRCLFFPMESLRHDVSVAVRSVLATFLGVDGDRLLELVTGSSPVKERLREHEIVLARTEALGQAARLGPISRLLLRWINHRIASRLDASGQNSSARVWEDFRRTLRPEEYLAICRTNDVLADEWQKKTAWSLPNWGYPTSTPERKAA